MDALFDLSEDSPRDLPELIVMDTVPTLEEIRSQEILSTFHEEMPARMRTVTNSRKINVIGNLISISELSVTDRGSLFVEITVEPPIGPMREIHIFHECEYFEKLSQCRAQLIGLRLRITRLKSYTSSGLGPGTRTSYIQIQWPPEKQPSNSRDDFETPLYKMRSTVLQRPREDLTSANLQNRESRQIFVL